MTLSSESLTKFMPAFLAAQAEFGPAIKGALNPHFQSRYVDLDGALEAVQPALLKHRIAVTQPTRIDGTTTILVTRFIHESGEWIGGEYPVRAQQQTPQSEGSALTYARRYALMALAGIAPEDDDGNSGSRQPPPPPPTAKQKLWGEIRIAARARGLGTDSDIKADFASYSQGDDINEADEAQLRKYLGTLKAPS
jgi:hypothetical protein